MTDVNQVYPSTLDSAGQSFNSQSGQLSQALGELVGTLSAIGNCWGNDDPGQAFGGPYTQHVQNMEDAARSLALGLDDVANQLGQMADELRNMGCDAVQSGP